MKGKVWQFIVILVVLIAGAWAGIVQASVFDGTSGGSFFLGVNSKTGTNSFINWYKALDNNNDGLVDAVNLVGSTASRSVLMGDLDIGLYPGNGKVQLIGTDMTPSVRNVYAWEATAPNTFYAHPTLGNIPIWNANLGRTSHGVALLEPVAGKSLMVTSGSDSLLITWTYTPGTPRDVPPGGQYYTALPSGTLPLQGSIDNFVSGGNQYVAVGANNSNIYVKGVNTTDGSYTTITNFNVGGNASLLTIGDLNNDGVKDDLVFYRNDNSNLYWYKIVDPNTIVYQNNWSTYGMGIGSGLMGTGLEIGDPVGDGKNRLIFTSSTNDNYYILGYNSSLGRPVNEFNAMLQAAGYTLQGVAIDVVPEPATLLMLGLGLPFFFRRTRRA